MPESRGLRSKMWSTSPFGSFSSVGIFRKAYHTAQKRDVSLLLALPLAFPFGQPAPERLLYEQAGIAPRGSGPAFDLLLHGARDIDRPAHRVLQLPQLPGLRVHGSRVDGRPWTVPRVLVYGPRWTVD